MQVGTYIMTSFNDSNSRLLQLLTNDSYNLDNYTTTENGAITLKSSGSAVLDFFSKVSAIRDKNVKKGELAVSPSSQARIEKLFMDAVRENIGLAVAALFYTRDIRSGQGERLIFRFLLHSLAKRYPNEVIKLVPFIPELGRWDDLFALKGTRPYLAALEYITMQLILDAEALQAASDGDSVAISLCAKWMPSERAGKRSEKLSYEVANALRLEMSEYRKFMSVLRQHLQIVETKMCEQRWSEIDYSKIPSRASFMYRKAFGKHDKDRYVKYIEAVKAGKTKINSGTLYPYEIIEQIIDRRHQKRDETLEQLWYALPNYISENHKNAIAVVDTSGSMAGTPMAVAVSLGMYLAERNTSSIWKNHFITFETNPHLVKIQGANLTEKVNNVYNAPWDGSTDLQAVFKLILETATRNNLRNDELPGIVYIISDMEFNAATNTGYYYSQGFLHGKAQTTIDTNLEQINLRYKNAGYERPKIVFWNVDGRNDQSPASFDERNVALFSGLSTTIFKSVLTGDFNPLTAMLDVLLVDRYLPIIEIMKEAK